MFEYFLCAISVFAVTVISPLEMIRTKMQSEQLTYRQVRQAVRTAIEQGGPLSLWKGLSPTLLRDVPFSGKTIKQRNDLYLNFSET